MVLYLGIDADASLYSLRTCDISLDALRKELYRSDTA
jgi:hypothetical protein